MREQQRAARKVEIVGQPTNPQTELAEALSPITVDDLPEPVLERVKNIVLDTCASALAGRHGLETLQIEALAGQVGGERRSTVIAGPTSSLVGATLLNGYQITAVTVCDVHRPTLCHVTPEVFPPALAVAEKVGASGAEFLGAVAAGLETTVRVGLGTNYPEFRRRGWHSPGVTGPFGGAAAVAKLLDLDTVGFGRALGLAGSQSAGTFAAWGTPTIKFHQSRGAVSGLLAGMLAAEEFKASEDILTHPDGGIYNTYSDGGRPDLVTDGLGDRWALMDISLRLWPAASSLQALVTAAMALAIQHDLDPGQISSVRVGLSETVYGMHGTLDWGTKFTALLSAPYVVGVVLHDRQCWLDQFDPIRIADPLLDAFVRERITVDVDESVEGTGASLEIALADGTVHRDVRAFGKGDSQDPLTPAEIEDKLRLAARGLVTDGARDALVKTVGRLEHLDNIAELCSLLRREQT